MVKIMVVDNEPDTVELVKTMLEAEGHKAIIAYSGKECLDKLKNEKPDLLILDMMMPEMSGWDVFQKIRKTDKKTPIMFLTVMFASRDRVDAMKKGGLCAYVTKPFNAAELRTAVAKCLSR